MLSVLVVVADSPKWTDQGGFWLALAAALLAVLGYAMGIVQYKKTQRWEVAKTLPSLILPFTENPRIRAVRIMLDWDARRVEIESGRTITFSNDLLRKALRVPLRGVDWEFSEREVMIRDAFDAFFDYFEQLDLFKRKELLGAEDLRFFDYWLELVRNLGRYKNDEGLQKVVHGYIRAYGFKGFQSLMNECPAAMFRELLDTKEKEAIASRGVSAAESEEEPGE